MQQAPNVTITTVEALMFELLGTEDHPAYHDICLLMKDHCDCDRDGEEEEEVASDSKPEP